MKELLDNLIQSKFDVDPATWPMTQGVYLAGMMLVGVGLVTFGALFAGAVSWWERRVAGRMQSRIGPNRVGPGGFLQWIADALKLILKEDLIPTEADHFLFRIAPYFVAVGFLMTFAVLPFGYHLSATSLNVGLFYVVSITALVVVGILVSGWASNSKWALFGGIRAAAQVVSYEIPAGFALLVPVMMAGSLNMHDIIRAQGGMPWDWFMFQTPMGYVGFFVLFVALLAEGNRTPFDLPEAESELVAGYNTEYSGARFMLFFLAEWGNLWVMSALLTTLFLGGWQVPGVDILAMEKSGPYSFLGLTTSAPGWYYVVSTLFFCAKTIVLVNVVIWIRWTFPRIRVDQMMSLCWKYLVPVGMALVVLTAITEVVSFNIWGQASIGSAAAFSVRWWLHFAFFAVAGLLPFAAFASRVLQNIRVTGDRVDLSNW
ncbi:MAG: NADH-quinone oxidoreductase subunit NuoH [Myxococcaceae bacterium]